MNKFCIFAGARTGSSSLYEFFMDYGVRIRFEPFRPNRWIGKEFDVKIVADEIFKFSDAIKHIWDHMSIEKNEELIDYLDDNGIKIIYLTRKNKFWQAISRALAFQTNYWGNSNNTVEEKVGYELLELKPISASLIKDYISMSELSDKVFSDMLCESDAEIWTYEELFTGNYDLRISRISELLESLGMKWSPFSASLFNEHMEEGNKVNTYKIYHKIPNWNELKEAFHIEEEPV